MSFNAEESEAKLNVKRKDPLALQLEKGYLKKKNQ